MLLFDRKSQLLLKDGTEFNSWEGVRFKFEYSTLGDNGVPTAEIEILNLDRDLRTSFKEQSCVFSIGYGDYLGDLIQGDMTNLEVEETVLFDVVGNNSNNKNYSNWYNTNVREDFIVEDIAKNAGIKLKGSELLKNYSRQNGYTLKGSAINSIQEICSNRGLGVTFKGDNVTIYELKGKEERFILLDVTSGLTNVTKYFKKDSKGNLDTKYDFVVHSLPIPTLKQGMIIQVEHDTYTGKLNVVDFEIRGGGNWKAKYFCKMITKGGN